MKRTLIILVFSFVSISIAFSQEKDSLFKESSIGANYMLNFDTRFREMHYQHFFGLSFDRHIYKAFFVSTEVKFSQEKHEEEGLFHDFIYGTYYYENKYIMYYFTVPINIKYYFLQSSLLCPYIVSGINNNLIYKKGFYKAHGEKNNIDEKIFYFNFIIGGGAEIKIINNMGFSLELLYNNIPQYYNYNLKKSGVTPYNFGIKGTVSYLF